MFKNKFHSDFSLSSFVWCFFSRVFSHLADDDDRWPIMRSRKWNIVFFNSTFLLSFFTDHHRKWYFSSAAEARAAAMCWKMLKSSAENEWNDLWFFSSKSTYVLNSVEDVWCCWKVSLLDHCITAVDGQEMFVEILIEFFTFMEILQMLIMKDTLSCSANWMYN